VEDGVAEDLLIEIGTEEIPASFVGPALESLGRVAAESLERLRLDHGEFRLLGTPRRLAILVEGVATAQRDLDREVVGPPKRVALDEQGKPTAAAMGFARTHGVEVGALKVVETSKGPYVAARVRLEGRPAPEVLGKEIPQWITGIPFPKSMRWRDLSLRFVRPIHWIAALFGREVVPFALESLQSGVTTRGHRFMGPREARIPEPSSYVNLCRALYVLVDPAERRETILREAREAARGLSGRLVEDPELLETLVHLVEYPVVVAGEFEAEFLGLPREVLITAMREHQKFFSVEDEAGHLMPHFVNIANIRPHSLELIRKGNERVLRARLRDARFFFQEDRKRRLEERVEALGGVIFHAKLGTLLEKVMRIRALALAFARQLEPGSVAQVDRAAFLCKADLTTDMVGEFPTLQGIMGREYALLEGEDPQVAGAIEEHYLPAFSGDRLPASPVGALVAMADKMDTIVGCFGVGELPTGAGDPFGLRRAALGTLHILLDRGYELPLGRMVDEALGLLEGKLLRPKGAVRDDVLGFLRVRLENLWATQGHSAEAVEAVVGAGFENLPDAFRRLRALGAFMAEEGFADLSISFKRVLNIVAGTAPGPVDPERFQHPEERDLHEALVEAEAEVEGRMRCGEPLPALKSLAAQKARIDRFFDAVLVNVEDQGVRENRLHLLARLGALFLRLADFSKITARP
jgi:glycyl-tRNA synthetase beta chain